MSANLRASAIVVAAMVLLSSNDALVKYYGTNFTDHSGDISQMPLNFGFISNFAKPSDVTPKKVFNWCAMR